MTISTAGVVTKIYKRDEEKLPEKVARRGKASNNERRKKIMQLKKKKPIDIKIIKETLGN